MKKIAALTVTLAFSIALSGPASAHAEHDDGDVRFCGSGEPAYTGWNYWNLVAYDVACRNAHDAASEWVYDESTEGAIEPPEHWDLCKSKVLGENLLKGKCTKTKDGRKQKITFIFGGPDQPWYRR